jgi:putative hydrolase of the HAD superfamily
MFEHVRLICFDLDDTLWPCRPVIEEAEQVCYAWLEAEAPRLTSRYSLDQLRAHRLQVGRRQPHIAHDMTEVRRHSLAQLLNQTGYAEALAQQASDVFRQARNRVTPYEDVKDALARLSHHFTLVSVTNGNSQIEHTPLADSFDHSLSAAEVGAAKPDPAMFHAASARSGIPLSSFLHVGDDPLRDVQAARNLDVKAVWVNRDGKAWPTTLARADLEVVGLSELVFSLIG